MPEQRITTNSLLAGSLIIVALIIAGLLFWKSPFQEMPPPPGRPPAVIAATQVQQESWQPSLQAAGSLVAINGIDVSTEVNGIVSEIIFSSGQQVKEGEILVRLEDSVDRAALKALRAESKLAQVQFNRAQDLLKKRVISKSEFDEAEARFDASMARLNQQEAVIKRKVIRAPFAGMAGIRQVDLGQFVEAGMPIVSLQALDPIYVDYNMSERYLSRLETGQPVTLQLDAFPDQEFSGEISALNPGVDTGTRTMKIRATLQNPDKLMRPGMFARVETITDEAQTVLTLPRTAISFNTYGNFVFVINDTEKGALTVKRTLVQTGEIRKGRVAITGLPLDTRVARTGLIKLRDGMAVKVDNQVELNDSGITGE